MAGWALTAPRGVDRFGWSERIPWPPIISLGASLSSHLSDERSKANTAQAARRFPLNTPYTTRMNSTAAAMTGYGAAENVLADAGFGSRHQQRAARKPLPSMISGLLSELLEV
jgi:hypothetical protein